MESMFVTRIIRLRLLEEAYAAAQAHVSKIVRMLHTGLE